VIQICVALEVARTGQELFQTFKGNLIRNANRFTKRGLGIIIQRSGFKEELEPLLINAFLKVKLAPDRKFKNNNVWPLN